MGDPPLGYKRRYKNEKCPKLSQNTLYLSYGSKNPTFRHFLAPRGVPQVMYFKKVISSLFVLWVGDLIVNHIGDNFKKVVLDNKIRTEPYLPLVLSSYIGA